MSMLARLRNTKNPVSLYKQKLYVFDEKIDWLQKAESTKMAVITIFKFINIGFLILIPSVTDVILLWENTDCTTFTRCPKLDSNHIRETT